MHRLSGELDCSVSLRAQGDAPQILMLGMSWPTPWQQGKQYPGFVLRSTNVCPGVCCPQAQHHLGLRPCAGDASWESGRAGFTCPPKPERWLLVPAPPAQRAAVTSPGLGPGSPPGSVAGFLFPSAASTVPAGPGVAEVREGVITARRQQLCVLRDRSMALRPCLQ